MSILWAGQEDIDFPNGGAVTSNTTAGLFRTGYARCAIQSSSTGLLKSSLFPGGAVTSAWFTCRSLETNNAFTVPLPMIGVGKSGSNNGLFIGLTTTTPCKIGLMTYNGTTITTLATESGNSMTSSVLNRFDVQIISYGTSATVNVYLNQVFLFTFTGNVTVTGMTNFDSIYIYEPGATGVSCHSEIIVADEDTRSFSLMTMAPISAGTTSSWTGLFSAVNPITINDANSVFTNTVSQDTQFNVTALPSGTFAVRQVKVNARMSATAGSTATHVATGFNLSGTVSVGTPFGPLGTAFVDEETYYTNNPVTSAAWTTTQLGTIQVDLRSS
jgi:hypothetical protein